MGVENGKAVESVKNTRANGHANGHLNGHLNGHAIGHTATTTKRRAPPRRSWTLWLINNIARLSIWYAILTVLFRCPSDSKALTDTSPWVCKPYIGVKTYVQPHWQPYYDAHAAPYVEKVRPYVDQANTYVVGPSSRIVIANYEKFAAPQLEKLKVYLVSEWDRMMLPQFLIAQQRASDLYTSNLAPHVDKASSIASPYYEAAVDNAVNVHQQHILPALEVSKPHLHNAYTATRKFAVGTALPLTQQAWSKLIIFVDGTLWPFVKGVYSHNVRPQLVMITERIATYQEGRKLRSIIDETEASSESTTTSATVSEPTVPSGASIPGVAESMTSIISSIAEEVSSSVMPKATRQPEVATEESITEDLVKSQKKFALAADKGAEDLRDRVSDLVDSLVRSDLNGEGKSLARALQTSTEVEIEQVKAQIQAIVSQVPDEADASTEKKAEEEVTKVIRDSGREIKERAKKLRDWAHQFQADLSQRTMLAADSTLQVLDSIRDLGLQEIGMRWAWMEGVTYKHWAKYHDLKQRFDEWRSEVRGVAVNHAGVVEARDLAQQILEEGMAITEDAAKELIRLKEVSRWKIRARDATDNFETRVMPAAALSAVSKLAEEFQGVTSSLVSGTQGTMESFTSEAAESASSLSSAAESAVAENAEVVQSKASSLIDKVSNIASDASTSIIGTPTGTVESFISDAASSISSAVVGSSTGTIESVASSVSSAAGNVYESVSSVVQEADKSGSSVINLPPVSSAITLASTAITEVEEAFESASDLATSVVLAASSKVFAGAMAQEVKGQIPILDDVFDDDTKESFSESVRSLVSDAGDQYADITKAISEALYGTSQGTVESFTSLASEQYQSALSAASSVLYGTPTPAAEILASAAQSRYQQAVAAASSAIYATRQTAVPESLLQEASAAYSAALQQAQEYRSAAAEVVSKQIATSSKPIHSQMLESIASAFDGSVAIASARLEEARIAASNRYASISNVAASALPTQNKMESISSVASFRLQEALGAANAQYRSVKVAAGVEPAPATVQAQQAYYAAVGYAYEQYDNFLSAGSSAVYGTPTPAYQSLLAQASSQYSVVSVAASSSMAAYLASLSSIASQATKTKSPAQSLLDEASASYSSALSVASISLSAASVSASVAVFGTPAPAYQSALDAVTSQYAAATALAMANMNDLVQSASSAVGKKKKSPAQSVLDSISSQYNDAVAAASSSLSAASSSASYAYYGPSEGSFESVASAASVNWDALIAAASANVYGRPTPVWASVTSQAGEYTAQATEAAAEQFKIISAYVSEVIVGREPDYTESVLSRLSSVYYTGVLASASSLASEAYASGSSIASSVSSVASIYFTPPPEISSILDSVNAQLNAAVEAASMQVYGSTKGPVEKATSAAADAYSAASSAASEALYGTSAGYGEAASKSIADAAQSASDAIFLAIYGRPTGTVASATSVVADSYSSVSSVVSENLSSAADQAISMAGTVQAKVSEAVFGPEDSAMESAQSRIFEAVESARSKLAEMGVSASINVESLASQVSSGVSSATSRVKDEL